MMWRPRAERLAAIGLSWAYRLAALLAALFAGGTPARMRMRSGWAEALCEASLVAMPERARAEQRRRTR